MVIQKPTVRIAGIQQDPDTVVGVKIAGGSGTGKTLFQTKLAIDVATKLGDPSIHLDLAGNLAEVLRHNGCTNVKVIDAVNEGGCGIDLWPFLRSPADCQRMANKLAPEIKNDVNPFWRNFLVMVFYYVLRLILFYNQKKGAVVHLADVVRIAKNRPLMKHLGRPIKDRREPFADITHHELLSNVLATLNVHLLEMEVVAALMLHCKEHLDLSDPQGTIVVRWSDRFRNVLGPLFTGVFESVIEYRLAFVVFGRLWLFLDEYASFGKIDALTHACRRGRKHGCKIVIALQEIAGLYDLYGSHDAAEELMGLCAHTVFTRVGSPMMARWSADYCGDPSSIMDVWPHSSSQQRGPTRDLRDDHNYKPDELRRLPLPDFERDEIHAVIDFPTQTGRVVAPWKSEILGVKQPNLRPRGSDQMVIPSFCVADLERLGMPVTREIIEALSDT